MINIRLPIVKFFHRVIYLCYLVLAVSLLCEGAIRAYSRFFSLKIMQIDPTLGWRHAANRTRMFRNEFGENALVVYNELGNRGPNYGPQIAAGKKRVLLIGDSFIEGAEVGESRLFTNMLATTYSDLEVINAGIGAYSTVQEYFYLRTAGLSLRPDLVLLMFYGNDLTENCLSFYPTIGPRPFASIQNGQLAIHTNPSPKEYLKYALPFPFAEELNQYSLAYNVFNTRLYQQLRSRYLKQMESDDVKIAELSPRMEIITKIYQKMQEMLKERDIKFAVGFIPSRDEAKKGISEVHLSLLSFCEQQGIPAISLLQPFHHAYGKGMKPYFEIDIHWSSEGHRVASEALGPFIRSLLSNHQRN